MEFFPDPEELQNFMKIEGNFDILPPMNQDIQNIIDTRIA